MRFIEPVRRSLWPVEIILAKKFFNNIPAFDCLLCRKKTTLPYSGQIIHFSESNASPVPNKTGRKAGKINLTTFPHDVIAEVQRIKPNATFHSCNNLGLGFSFVGMNTPLII